MTKFIVAFALGCTYARIKLLNDFLKNNPDSPEAIKLHEEVENFKTQYRTAVNKKREQKMYDAVFADIVKQ